jgi:septum formation inhibitor-activating ATPase MinD
VGLPNTSIQATLDAGRRSRDLIVVDVPRSLDHGSGLALEAADRAFLVVPAELRACAAAARVARLAVQHTEALEVIVREPAPGGLDARDIARAVGLPLAGTLRTEPRIVRGLEQGAAPASTGRGSLAMLCRRLIEELWLNRGQVAA